MLVRRTRMLRWTIPTFSVWPNIPADATASRISCWGSRVAVPFRETFKAVDGVPCRMSRRASAAWMVDRTSSLLATRLGPGQSTIVNGVEHVAVRTFRMRDFASSWGQRGRVLCTLLPLARQLDSLVCGVVVGWPLSTRVRLETIDPRFQIYCSDCYQGMHLAERQQMRALRLRRQWCRHVGGIGAWNW